LCHPFVLSLSKDKTGYFDQSIPKEALILLVIPEYSRHPWRSRYAPPSAFAFAILQTQSRSDIRDPAALRFITLQKSHWVPALLAPSMALALRASCAVRARSCAPRRRDDEGWD
jgi:hypothetical protein